jgi:hypothetical protein
MRDWIADSSLCATSVIRSGVLAARPAHGHRNRRVALALARLNAAAAGTSLDARLAADPGVVPNSELTVCNFPTQGSGTTATIAGLCGRTASGTVLVIVHANLEYRYVGRFARSGASSSIVRRGTRNTRTCIRRFVVMVTR